jgi:hypothetical protein
VIDGCLVTTTDTCVALTAIGEPDRFPGGAGRVHVFDWIDNGFLHVGFRLGEDWRFGKQVAISSDGGRVAVSSNTDVTVFDVPLPSSQPSIAPSTATRHPTASPTVSIQPSISIQPSVGPSQFPTCILLLADEKCSSGEECCSGICDDEHRCEGNGSGRVRPSRKKRMKREMMNRPSKPLKMPSKMRCGKKKMNDKKKC